MTSAVILSFSSTVSGTPLFFDFLKRTFGKGNKRPTHQRPQVKLRRLWNFKSWKIELNSKHVIGQFLA